MIHHPDVLDARRLGLGDDRGGGSRRGAADRRATRSSTAAGRSASDRSRRTPLVSAPRTAAGAVLAGVVRFADRAGTSAAGTSATGSGVTMSCHGSLATSDLTSGHRRSWLATTSGRTAISRAPLRRRHSWAGVSNTTAMHGMPAAAARSRQRRRWSASRPSVSMTVVSRRRSRRVTMSSSSANASVDAARSCSPSPTSARSASLDTICAGSNHCAAHVDFPDATGPTSTTTHGDGNASGSSVGTPVTIGHATRRSRLLVLAGRGHGPGILRADSASAALKAVGNGNALRANSGWSIQSESATPQFRKASTRMRNTQIRLLRTRPSRRDPRRRSALRGGHRQLQAEPVQDRAQGPLPAPDPHRTARDDRPPRRASRVRSRDRRREGREVHPAGTRR